MLKRFATATALLSGLAGTAGAFVDPVDPLGEPTDIGGGWTAQYGLEMRVRAENRANQSLTNTSPVHDNFYLTRARVSADFRHDSGWGFYFEGIDARITSNRNPAPMMSQNDLDFRNAFVDYKQGDTLLRFGRQDLSYGAQRLVSPIDWDNTRRTFEGFLVSQGTEDGFVDVFLTHPVVIDAHSADQSDYSQWFGGVYWGSGQSEEATYGTEAYVLLLREDTDKIATVLPTADIRGQDVLTYGARAWGLPGGGIDWEMELARQSGSSGGHRQRAWMAGGTVGITLEDVGLTPRLGLDVEYGSGDDDPTDSTNGTFNQLFPNYHGYLGMIDLFGRQNILDIAPNVSVQIDEQTSAKLSYHMYELNEDSDALYGPGGGILFQDPTGASGDEVGDELELLISHYPEDLAFADRITLGLSSFNPGDFVETVGSAKHAKFAYLELQKRF